MRTRPLLTAALTAGTLAAAAITPAHAQPFSSDTRWYQASGCDDAFADVFGTGPRLCATAVIGVSDLTHSLLITQATIVANNWYRAGSTDADPGVGFSPGAYGIDGGLTQCRVFACLGSVTESLVEDAYTTSGYVPQYLTMDVRYYQAPPSAADLADVGRVSTFRLDATVIPEPATFALLAAGLATLGAVSRGARRRRTRAGS